MTKQEKQFKEKLTQYLRMVEQDARTKIIDTATERGTPEHVVDLMLEELSSFVSEAFELWDQHSGDPDFLLMIDHIDKKHLNELKMKLKEVSC